MLSKSNISFKITDCPDDQMLWDYQKGILSRDQIRVVEHHLADCEMCSDFIEGISLIKSENELENETEKIVSKIYNKISKKNKIWLYSTAASLFIAIGLTTFILLFPSKNSYVVDENINLIPKDSRPVTGEKQPDNLGWIKNENEVTSNDVLISQQDQKIVKNNIQYSAPIIVEEEVFADIAQEQQEEIVELDNSIIANTATIVDKVSVVESKEREKSPGKSEIAGDALAEDKKLESTDELKSKDSESSKKNKVDQSLYKSDDSKGVVAGSISTGQTAATRSAAEETVSAPSFTSVVQNNEPLISDLDKANDFLDKEQSDSAIVYALRGANSNNENNKWKSKLCLAKAYIAKGEKEKAIPILKEIKAKASYKISKDADAELEKLGN